MLGCFDALGSSSSACAKCSARAFGIALESVFGCGLNQRCDGVAACNVGCERVIRVSGVESDSLVVINDRLFKMLVHEELARGEIQLGSTPAVAVARRSGTVAGVRNRLLRILRLLGLP